MLSYKRKNKNVILNRGTIRTKFDFNAFNVLGTAIIGQYVADYLTVQRMLMKGKDPDSKFGHGEYCTIAEEIEKLNRFYNESIWWEITGIEKTYIMRRMWRILDNEKRN